MENSKSKNFYLPVLKGVLMALIITLVAILVFAWIIKVTDIQNGTIQFINQIVKAIAIFFGCFYSIKSGKSFVKGLFIGLITTFAAFIIFAILDKRSIFDVSILYEMLFGAICGAVCGIIVGIFKKTT